MPNIELVVSGQPSKHCHLLTFHRWRLAGAHLWLLVCVAQQAVEFTGTPYVAASARVELPCSRCKY